MGRSGVRAAVACALRKAPCELRWPASGTAFMGRSGPHLAGLFAGCADLYLTGPFAGRGWVHSAEPFMGRSDPHPTEPFMDCVCLQLHKSRSQVTDFKNVLRHAMMLRS